MRRVLFLCLLGWLLAQGAFGQAPEAAGERGSGIGVDQEGEQWARATLKKMSLEEKVGQMFMIWARAAFFNVNGPEYQQLRDTMRRFHIGAFGVTVPWDGSLLKKSSPYEMAALINQLQRDSELPLIFAADFERGVPMRLNGGTVFPSAMALGAAHSKDFAFLFGRITAIEARAVGVHWNFFPVADVNSNPLNPIINTRSFGEDVAETGELVTAYIAGARGTGMLTTAKHFPGHGDTQTDTHLAAASVRGDRKHLNEVELAPFRAAIAAGVDSIMMAHVTAPALDPDSKRVASLSPRIIQEVLRHQMGFRGLVVTDAMDMGALTSLFAMLPPASAAARAAVEAVKAGEDMLVAPADLENSYRGVVQAVRSGEIAESRIDDSVLKILRAKAGLKLHQSRLVDLNALAEAVGRPENQALAQQIADAAVTLVRDNGRVLPLKSSATGGNDVVAVVFTDDARGDSGRMLDRLLRARLPSAAVYYVDEASAAWLASDVLEAVRQARVVIAPVYIVPVPGREPRGADGGLGMEQSTGDLLKALLASAGSKTVVLAMGSPYMASNYPEVQNYLCLYSTVTVSEISAVKAIFGEIPLRGTLPVTLPRIASRGAGLRRGLGWKPESGVGCTGCGKQVSR
jgi:beta-N-acetylhexosaminidase